jgi:S1-C subfamily serine protease
MLPSQIRRLTFQGMRTLLLSMVFFPWSAACGPKVSTAPTRFDDELMIGKQKPVTAPPVVEAKPRPEAAPGKGLRTGTISREKLVAVLNAGPGTFLRQLEVAPKKQGERFVGWELVQVVDRASPLVDVDLLVGDVLLAINGKPISRPDQLQAVWESLRTANEVTAQLWRGDTQLTLAFAIDPKL